MLGAVRLSSFRPRSSLISVPEVSTAMSPSMAAHGDRRNQGLHRADVQHPAELVHHQSRQGFAIDVFGDNQQRLADAGHRFEHRDKLAKIRELLFVNQDIGIVQLAIHFGRPIDEIGRNKALVELHTVDELDGRLHRLAFFDRDHAVFADLFQRLGQQLADRHVVVGADRSDLGNFLRVLHRPAHLLQLLERGFDGFVDPAADGHRVAAGGDVAGAFFEDRASQHRGGRRAVAGNVRCFGGHFIDELGAHVLEAVFKLDFFRNRNTVFRDCRAAERLRNDDVAAGRTHRHGYGMSQLLDPFEHSGSGLILEQQLFCHE